MDTQATIATIQQKFNALSTIMDERMRRRWAAAEANSLGRGGIAMVARATGLSRTTIQAGRAELADPTLDATVSRIRRQGAGRPRLSQQDARLLHDLKALVEPATRGDPQSPLLWTSKSTRNLADELVRLGHAISHDTVGRLLEDMDYSLQANRKTREGKEQPDRDAQFDYLNRRVQQFQRRGQPVVSVDTKKKELLGDFKQSGRDWRPQGCPEPVRTHDFRDKELGIGIPYGVYDLTRNNGWVSVGIDHDTAAFATETIRRWWMSMGSLAYPAAKELLLTADGGGSNSSRTRLWKVCLQKLADELGLNISVGHFPPGTSKWNKIEHRMFCHITENWRGRPLLSRAVIVNLIGSTTTRMGLHINAELDAGSYPIKIKVTDEELALVRIKRATFHGNWNYTITPHE
jgi:Rhodopirellula transposase DDE domain